MKSNRENINTLFKLNYKKGLVKFKNKIYDKKKMGIKEFAIKILQIEPISTEVIAVYIGKLGFDVYNKKGKFKIMITKKIKDGIKGNIIYDEK